MNLSVPSKTYIVGEYNALEGGACLLACTIPRFSMACTQGAASLTGNQIFHADSPAGRWERLHQAQFNTWQLTFTDPHMQKGGLGGSSAQFAMLWACTQALMKQPLDLPINCDQVIRCIKDYQSTHGSSKAGSGVDIAAQLTGQVCVFERNTSTLSSHAWPWKNAGFIILHTGTHQPTHLHLANLTPPDCTQLQQIALDTIEAFKTKQLDAFCKGINDYGDELEQLGLSCVESKQKRKFCAGHTGVLAVKQCGALGADTLLLIVDRKEEAHLKDWAKLLSLELVATEADLSEGLIFDDEAAQ